MASSVSGRTPMAATTTSAGSTDPSASVTSFSPMAMTPEPSLRSMPASRITACTGTTISGSSGAITWGSASTTATCIPRCSRFSATSSPTKPPPTTTAVRRPVDGRDHPVRVLHVAQGQRAADAGDGGHEGLGAGGEDQLVVGEGLLAARGHVAHHDLLGLTVDLHRLGAHAHVQPEPVVQGLRGLQQQRRTVLDHSAHVIGKAAVGEGHVAAPLHHDDLRGLVETTQTRRRAHPTSNSTNDYNSHVWKSYTPGGMVGEPG